MYGRSRGFDIANNKTALYFDVEDNFFRNAPLNAAYPVTIELHIMTVEEVAGNLFMIQKKKATKWPQRYLYKYGHMEKNNYYTN
jgi:hypothetical protein